MSIVPVVFRGATPIWEIGEPSLRDIHGRERMRLVRDEIDARVHRLYEELVGE